MSKGCEAGTTDFAPFLYAYMHTFTRTYFGFILFRLLALTELA